MIKKKIILGITVISMALSLCSCGKEKQKDPEEKINIDSENDSADNDNAIVLTPGENVLENEQVLDKIDEINGLIDYYFYFETDVEAQEEAIYDGIMEGLGDPYSVYYTAEEFADLMESNSGEYVGIGAVVSQDASMVITIVRPIPNSPAEEVGLMAEDIIVQVDELELTDEDINSVVEKIRGKEGTTAYIKVFRPSINDYLEFDVPRRVVENYTVYTDKLENDITYIQVQGFDEKTFGEFKDAIDVAESDGTKGLIIDLRDNSGGLLDAVVDMCDYMMNGGTIVTTKDKNGVIISKHIASTEHYVDMPIVVLINGNSASASEIFAGAMKDTGMATLVGTNTFGKGIVQSVIPLEDGTAIKLTIAKYFTPNGNDIHQIGIAPDYEVELPDGRTNAVNIDREDDTQLEKGIELLEKKILNEAK